jgi:hypothetical protein
MPGKIQCAQLLMASLAIACGESPAAPQQVDLTGAWAGGNSVVALDLRLSNAIVTSACPAFGCTGQQTTEQVRLVGSYADLRNGESVDLATDTERRADGLLVFILFVRDDGLGPLNGVTYATRRLVGQVVDANTIEATLMTDYARSSGGNSISWTTWTQDSTTLTLNRR